MINQRDFHYRSPDSYSDEEKMALESECFRKLGDIKKLAHEIIFSSDFYINHIDMNRDNQLNSIMDDIIDNVEKAKLIFKENCPHNFYF